MSVRIDKEIQDRITDVDNEENARITAVTNEANLRTQADIALGVRIDSEITARENAISGEVTARNAAIASAVQVETNARTQADNALGLRIDAEIQNRIDKDAELLAVINQERQDRLDAQRLRDIERGSNIRDSIVEHYVSFTSIDPTNEQADILDKRLMGSIPLTDFENEAEAIRYNFQNPFKTVCLSVQLTLKNPDISPFVDAVVNLISYDLSGFRFLVHDLWDIKDIKKCYVDFLATGY